jgi:hypothetical protein
MNETSEEIVAQVLKRTRLIYSGLGAALLAGGVFVVLVIVDPNQNNSGAERAGLIALGGILVGLGLVALFAGVSMLNLQQRPIMRLLRDHPQDIAQVMSYVTSYRGIESYVVRITPKSGKPFNLSIKDAQQATMLVNAIHERAPRARIEYSKRN